jgi:hypothetical protein
MANTIKSIFGQYATKMQMVIDNSLDKFAPTWFQNYFDFDVPQATLDYVSVIGASRVEAAASVVDRESAAPFRSRPDLSKLSGEIPAIKEARKMKESDYRNFLTLQALPVSEQTKKQQLLDFLFNDIKTVGNGAMKRVDMMALQAISTGKIKISSTTNPDGLILSDLDLLLPSGNTSNSATSWDNAAATPLTVDIPAVVAYGRGIGVSFAKMLMTPTQFINFQKITEVKSLLSNFLGFKQSGNVLATLDNINVFLQANRFPVIELVDESIGVEKDGVITASNPFETNNVTFVPAGKLGTIKNAIAIEELRPVEHVTYAKFQNALISKYAQNNPFGEFTVVELNACPAFEAINQIYILVAVH